MTLNNSQLQTGFYKTKYELVYETLREAILSGLLKPGEPLVAGDLAEKMGLSRMPIREAVKRLEAEGLVKVVPHHVPVVAEISFREVMESFVVRERLEGLATYLSCENRTDELFAELEKVIGEMESVVAEGKIVHYGRLNLQFHRIIAGGGKNGFLTNMLEENWRINARARIVFAMDPQFARESLEEHREILLALKNGTPDEVERIARRHVKGACDALARQIAEAKNERGELTF